MTLQVGHESTFTGHFIPYLSCYYWIGPSFAFRNVFILCGINSTRSISPDSKGALLDLDLLTVEGIVVQ